MIISSPKSSGQMGQFKLGGMQLVTRKYLYLSVKVENSVDSRVSVLYIDRVRVKPRNVLQKLVVNSRRFDLTPTVCDVSHSIGPLTGDLRDDIRVNIESKQRFSASSILGACVASTLQILLGLISAISGFQTARLPKHGREAFTSDAQIGYIPTVVVLATVSVVVSVA